ncbi:creatininase family protein [Candidatus Poribacteria bacterium]|nr:creatininase family protein [Candidatus Poribacteria bacterium]
MEKEVRWERMFPDQLETAFDSCPAVYFTYGLCEPHGPQNTVGLDALKAHAIACRTAQTYGGIVAPPDYWHIHEHGMYANWAQKNVGEVRSWLTAMPAWQHFKNVCYHVRAADALGFQAAIFLTGHYGPNWQDLKTLLNLIQPNFAMRLYGLPDFEANHIGFSKQGDGGDHAGRVETSLLWALEPDCVDVSRMPEPETPGPHFAMGSNAYDSDRLTGERMVNDEVQWLGKKMQELLDEYTHLDNSNREPVTFEQVEKIWAEQIKPVLNTFETMQNKGEPPPEDSQWFDQWKIPEIP